jgi:crotonobetainyl-CoA:carnitine CoA-transferase CaiB-like acyl-CoA transferase
LLSGETAPVGNRSKDAAPHGIYPCRGKDHWCAIAVFTDAAWRGLKKALGDPPWAEEKKYASFSGRNENSDELDRRISAWTKRHAAAEVMAKLQLHGVAAGLVQDASGLAADPQLKARGFFVDLPEIGRLVDASPVRLSDAPAVYHRPAPSPGRDNAYVYGKLLGLNQKEIDHLRDKGII